MNRLLTWVGVGLFFLLIPACGTSSSSSAPSASNGNGSTTTLSAPPAVTTDSRLPDLTNAVAIDLVDKVNYSGLAAISGAVSPPLVGDPLINLNLTSTGAGAAINGTILLSFEDSLGFWAAQQTSFTGTGQYTATSLDIIFEDTLLVTRVIGTYSKNSFTGDVYYRVRESTDPPVIFNGTSVPACTQVTCTGCSTQPNTVTPCENYMSTSNSSVVELGSFVNPSFSNWVTQ